MSYVTDLLRLRRRNAARTRGLDVKLCHLSTIVKNEGTDAVCVFKNAAAGRRRRRRAPLERLKKRRLRRRKDEFPRKGAMGAECDGMALMRTKIDVL